MSLVPRHQEFFYVATVAALVIMAATIVLFAHKTKNPQLETSKAAGPSQEEMMYDDTMPSGLDSYPEENAPIY